MFHLSISDDNPMSIVSSSATARVASQGTFDDEPPEGGHDTGAWPTVAWAACVRRGNETALGESSPVRMQGAAALKADGAEMKVPAMALPRSPQIIEVLLTYFLVPRPGFRVAKTGIKGYTSKDIRAAFHILRLERWLDARVVTDAAGKRYSGWMVTLTELGQAIAEALTRADPCVAPVESASSRSDSNNHGTPVPVSGPTVADKQIKRRAPSRRRIPADAVR